MPDVIRNKQGLGPNFTDTKLDVLDIVGKIHTSLHSAPRLGSFQLICVPIFVKSSSSQKTFWGGFLPNQKKSSTTPHPPFIYPL